MKKHDRVVAIGYLLKDPKMKATIEFNSLKEAGEYLHTFLGMNKNVRCQIIAVCKGRLLSCGKIIKEGKETPLTWEYKENNQ